MLNSLPPEYGDVLGQWETLHGSMKTTTFLESWLKQKEISLKESRSEAEFAVSGQQKKSWEQMSIRERKKISRCKVCNEVGHWAKECPKQSKESGGQGESQDGTRKQKMVLNIGNLGPSLKDRWILDSGGTQRMCNHKE